MYSTLIRPLITHRLTQHFRLIQPSLRSLTEQHSLSHEHVKILDEDHDLPTCTAVIPHDPLMQSIESFSSLSTLLPFVRANLPQQKAEHIAAALLRACNIVRSCVYFHPLHMETYREQLLAHPIFELLCYLCEHRLRELNFEDHVNIMSALAKLDVRLSSSESPFLRHLFTELVQTDYLEHIDLHLLNRFLISLVKKSNRHLRKSPACAFSSATRLPTFSAAPVQATARTVSSIAH